MYELTYATRGNSGIPRDALSVAKILQADPNFHTDFLLNPKGLTHRGKFIPKREKWASVDLGNALRKETGRSVLPRLLQMPMLALQSISLLPTITPFPMGKSLREETFNHLNMVQNATSESKIFLILVSYGACFARPGFLPITHPQFFDDLGVKLFSKSLRIMLKGQKKIWVMDSVASAVLFKATFGEDLDVRVIPCAVTLGDRDFD